MKTFKQFIREQSEKEKLKNNFDTIVNSPEFKAEQDNRLQRINPWMLVGHNVGETEPTISPDIAAMKEKVFGKRTEGTSHLWWYHRDHGLIMHPAIGDLTHAKIEEQDSARIYPNVDRKVSELLRPSESMISKIGSFVGIDPKIPSWIEHHNNILARGRIEHHEGGGGHISFAPGEMVNPEKLYEPRRQLPINPMIVRTLGREFPKHKIMDAFGNMIENTIMKNFKQLLEGKGNAKRLKIKRDWIPHLGSFGLPEVEEYLQQNVENPILRGNDESSLVSHEARVRAFLKQKQERPVERQIPSENPLYGTTEDPRLDITQEYRTSQSDPMMHRVMTAGDDLSYMGLTGRGRGGGNQYGGRIADPVEKQQRREEAIKRARAVEVQKRREKLIAQHISLEKRFSGVYTDAETGEERHGGSFWPPSGPWIHPWTGDVINNFVPIQDHEIVYAARPPRAKYPRRTRR